MARAHFVTYLFDTEGRPISGATVSVREPDTETLIAETIYAADDPDMTTKSNPFTADADGKCEIWLDTPKIVDLYVTKTGYDPSTIRSIAHQLTASTLTVKEAGTPLAQRAGVNFLAGFDLTDDAANDETEVAIDLGELTVFTDHSARHENGGADEISLAGLDGAPTELTNHLNDAADAHDASAISILDTAGDFTATDVEGALAELQTDAEAHLADATDAHDASAISIADAGGLFTATHVEGALAEAQTQLDLVDAGITNHLNDTTDAHDASAISIADAGGDFTATHVEGALAELQSDNETHAADGNAHVHAHTGSMIQENANSASVALTAVGDNQAVLNLASAAGLSEVWFEFVVRVDSGTNTQITLEITVHDPAHNGLQFFEVEVPALGAGTEYRNTVSIFARDTSPAAGDYHIEVNTISAVGGAVSVEGRRLVGIAS